MGILLISQYSKYLAVADLHSKILEIPRGPISFNLMQFLGKFGKIVCGRSPLPPRVGAPTLGKSWIRHCYVHYDNSFITEYTLSIKKLFVD